MAAFYLSIYLSQTTRVLAEEQFTKRALIEKIQLGIPMGTYS
jgi:ESCRT-I complex subunit TSG101